MPRVLIAAATIALVTAQARATEGPTAAPEEASLKKPAVIEAMAAERVFPVAPATVRKHHRIATTKVVYRSARHVAGTDCSTWCGHNFALMLGIGF
jgi:hypothetical protein